MFETPHLKLKPYTRVLLERIAEQCGAAPIDDRGSLGYAIMSHEELARAAVVCRRTAMRRLAQLEAMGLVIVVNRGGFDKVTGELLANTYCIPGEFGALDHRKTKKRSGGRKSRKTAFPTHSDSVTVMRTVKHETAHCDSFDTLQEGISSVYKLSHCTGALESASASGGGAGTDPTADLG